MESKALWHLSDQQSELIKTPLTGKHSQSYEVKTLFSLVSLGTERLVATGKVPVGLYESMKVPYMEGGFDFPVKYGYSLVGQIVSREDELDGRIVHLLHPHQSRCLVTRNAFTLVPSGIPPQRATLVSNLETALNAIWDAKVSFGDRVAVIGFGAIGALLSRLLSKIPGVELHVYEKNPARQSLLKAWRFSLGDPLNVSQPYDITFNCSSSQEGITVLPGSHRAGGKSGGIELVWSASRVTSVRKVFSQ